MSPPDAVSATTVLKTVKVPKRLASILEGESLLNDAASLIVFRFALVAVATGQFVFHEAALSFVVVIIAGILTGVVIAYIYYVIHRWLPTSPNMDIVLTLTAPYVMYIVAESFHVSGVLAVVSGGLFLSVRSHEFLSHRSRLRGSNVWSTLAFVLNGMVFMLIGLSLPVIVQELGPGGLKGAIGYGLLITGVLVITRLVCTLLASPFTVFMSRFITTADSSPGWKGPLIFGWAGMRGVVSLAAALSIPLLLQNGMPFPQRDMILFITFTVILLTLVVQGLTLPWLIRRINMPDPDHTMSVREQELLIGKELSKKGLQILDEEHGVAVSANNSLQQLRVRFENDQSHLGLADSADLADYQRVYLQLLEQQRQVLTQLNKDTKLDGDIIRKYQGLLDLEEEKLRTRFETE